MTQKVNWSVPLKITSPLYIHTHTHIHIGHRLTHMQVIHLRSYLSVDSLEKKQPSPGLSARVELFVAVLPRMGGGRVGNTEGPEVNQSGSESNT